MNRGARVKAVVLSRNQEFAYSAVLLELVGRSEDNS